MSKSLVYITVLALYFIVLLLIGYITKKKTKTSNDFHIGGRKIGAVVSSLSFVSAYFSSVVIIGGGGFGYKYGMATIWIGVINVLLGCMLAWMILGKRTRKMTAKLKAITIPDFLYKRYDLPFAKIFTSIVIALFMVIYNVSILKGLGNTFEVILNIPYIWGVIISGIMVLIYVSMGGYIAVVWTGFLQAIIMGAGLFILLFATLNKVGGLTAGVNSLKLINQNFVDTPGVWGFNGLISYILIVSLGVWGMPQMLARFYSIKNVKAIRIGTVIATIGGSMAIIPYLVGALTRTIYPALTNPDLAIPTLVNSIMSPFAVSIFFIGVIAAGMSTFSAVLIISSSAIIRDLFKESFLFKMTEKKEMNWSIIANSIVGIVSILIAIKPPGLVLTLTAFSWAIIASTCLIPFLIGLYWKGATKTGVVFSMVGGFCTALVWMILKQPYKIHGFIPGVLASLILMVVVSLITRNNKELIVK